MAASDCAESIRRVLLSEGGYVNHPSDPGGPTNFGVTIADYRRYVKPNATAADIRAMKVEQARAIYRAKYWAAIRADDLPAGVDYCLFDYAVNSGTGRAPKVLQRVLGIAVTGRVDDATIKAAAARDAAKLVQAISDERLRFMQGLKIWPVFGKGWARRVGEVKAAALVMAQHAAAPSLATAAGIADIPDPSATPGKGVVPAPAGLLQTVGKGAPTGCAALAWSAWDRVLANPLDAALLGIAAGAVTFVALEAIKRWHRAAQEAAVPFTVVPAAA